jgi:transcriptional regulator NrdR family protein
MKCSQCGGKTKVLMVRIDSKQTVHRRKKCVDCGYVFYTKEYEVVMGDEFKRTENLYKNERRTKLT